MNENDLMNLLNSIDDDLVDKKIDDLLNQKGEVIDMGRIKEKSLNKLQEQGTRRNRKSKKPVAAAVIAATLIISTAVYASEISTAIKSFFNKSMVYSTVVDGDAFYLPEEIKLNDDITLLTVSVSKDHVMMNLKFESKLEDEEFEGLNIGIIPKNNEKNRYTVGGYMPIDNGICMFSFINLAEKNYDIAPFKDFSLEIAGTSYDISLAKAEGVNMDNLTVGKPNAADDGSDESSNDDAPLIANVAGSIQEKDGKASIQLIAGFDDPELKLRTLGEFEFDEFISSFENYSDGSTGRGGGSATKPILAYDQNNTAYTLTMPEGALARPNTVFETDAKPDANLTVKLPAIVVSYEKQVESLNLTIPKEGKVALNKELDFIIQKAVVKSIERTSDTTAVIEFELNTGADKTVAITDLGVSSIGVSKAETVIKGNTATMTMTFDKNIDSADFTFQWPSYQIFGNWSIELGK